MEETFPVKLIQQITARLLYLTPFGYLLTLPNLESHENKMGISFPIFEDVPFQVKVQENPTVGDRANWFMNGSILLIQIYFIYHYNLGGKFGTVYGWMASIFAVVNILTALFTNFPWNKNIPIIRLKYIDLLVILTLFVSAFQDVINFEFH